MELSFTPIREFIFNPAPEPPFVNNFEALPIHDLVTYLLIALLCWINGIDIDIFDSIYVSNYHMYVYSQIEREYIYIYIFENTGSKLQRPTDHESLYAPFN